MIKKFLISIFLLIMSIIAVVTILPYAKKVNHEAIDESREWMKSVEDALLLSEINIPGTHNSATQYIDLPFFSRCQDLNIKEQLESGYRYLDIRLAIYENKLQLMHSFTTARTGIFPWSNKLYLEDILEDCYQFLDAYPTETILFSVRKEYGDESLETFQNRLNDYILDNQNYWLLTQQIPALSEARGKIVLLRRYDDEAKLGELSGLPFNWQDQSPKTAFENYTLFVQDQYEYDTKEKWQVFSDFLKTSEEENKEQIIINFLSTKGSFTYGYPYYFASQLNPQFLETKLESNSKYGWIIVDFADAKLARHIYKTND